MAEAEGNDATRAKADLRAALTAALRHRDAVRIRVLRQLIAALDDAEAVPPGDRHDRYRVHAFGDPAAEVARVTLTPAEVAAVLRREHDARVAAAVEATALGRSDRAATLAEEAAVIAEWLG